MNYYQVLGVPRTATLAQIKDAYRKHSKICHPDMGGSHEQMSSLNEAWEILSNPVYRKNYDKARNNIDDKFAQTVANKDAEQVYSRAREYPRTWPEFESWLDLITRDFTDAKYGTTDAMMGMVIPTANNSISGVIFILLGLAFGALSGLYLSIEVFKFPDKSSAVKIISLLATAAGAWVGIALHGMCGNLLNKKNHQ